MQLTQTLRAQHLGFMFKKHWRVQGKRVPNETGAEAELLSKGFKVSDPKFSRPKLDLSNLKIVGYHQKEVKYDQTHPNWHNNPCHLYKDNSILLEGLCQAQILTNTVHIKKFPQRIEEALDKTKIPDKVQQSMQEAILTCNVFDAQQEKTYIIKDPLRPAFNFPRNYGITDKRRNKLILSKLIQHCEKICGRTTTSERLPIKDAVFVVPFEKDEDLIQMEINAETIIFSKNSIKPFDDEHEHEGIPDLFPLKYTITLPAVNIYNRRNYYPISNQAAYNPHTILLHFCPTSVKNLHDIPITDSQFESRNFLKAFTVAAAKARNLYGSDVKQLPKPIVVQSVQTNGKCFSFGIYQLNTLNLNSDNEIKNQWFSKPVINLFTECCYKLGKPYLCDYNSDVIKYMKVFYSNN